MMENPNLIRRPILIKGSKVTSASTRRPYAKLMSRPHRHVGLELPAGQGHVERHLLSASRRARGRRRLRRAGVLRRALRHRRSELDLLRPAAVRGDARLGRAHAGGLRVLGQALSEVHPPRMFKRSEAPTGAAIRARRLAIRRRRPRRVPPRHRSARASRQARRAARAVSRELQERRRHRAATWSGCCEAFADYPRRRRAAAPKLERRSARRCSC